MKPIEFFRFCPRCSHEQPAERPPEAFRCGACGFLYYINPAVSVAAFATNRDGKMLFIRRAHEPGQGKLAVPGGFVDQDETAEEALRREFREEVNVELSDLQYLCSFANTYPYEGVTYSVLDLYFAAKVESAESAAALDGVATFTWLDPSQLDLSEIAFTSMRSALQRLNEKPRCA